MILTRDEMRKIIHPSAPCRALAQWRILAAVAAQKLRRMSSAAHLHCRAACARAWRAWAGHVARRRLKRASLAGYRVRACQRGPCKLCLGSAADRTMSVSGRDRVPYALSAQPSTTYIRSCPKPWLDPARHCPELFTDHRALAFAPDCQHIVFGLGWAHMWSSLHA